ncbi:hypothetical protein TcG_04984 [Trypanosoma cruzi]|uniref:Uncharacterized protein n=2 Tax=Trypanosoma cruzi TaxID=5693 RepID=V5DH83_TRYCR|nr:hypothetical protein TCDM_14115 [Trypanosoma cruzi Dm28c]KAF8282883.1 hypothetical protein TcBrA4_0079350 [Trypanosoma cruzi]PBJ72154.1 hypothetical protein BCY84_15730 [Trypanosoma cruzi cruzi]PWV00609.1 hypothetical protein C4B63_6g2282c [Trypanosoma cruzi]RNF18307.1 hypothetical protein TcG_04984 [Trypanosoma cruzi]
MAQKRLKGKSHEKSGGALRKSVGDSKKKTVYGKRRKTIEAKARASYASAVESRMASRVPSDQRGRLTVVKPTAGQTSQREKKKHMKKPLTRGRRRKDAKKA